MRAGGEGGPRPRETRISVALKGLAGWLSCCLADGVGYGSWVDGLFSEVFVLLLLLLLLGVLFVGAGVGIVCGRGGIGWSGGPVCVPCLALSCHVLLWALYLFVCLFVYSFVRSCGNNEPQIRE